jgi:hypothetical protein
LACILKNLKKKKRKKKKKEDMCICKLTRFSMRKECAS